MWKMPAGVTTCASLCWTFGAFNCHHQDDHQHQHHETTFSFVICWLCCIFFIWIIFTRIGRILFICFIFNWIIHYYYNKQNTIIILKIHQHSKKSCLLRNPDHRFIARKRRDEFIAKYGDCEDSNSIGRYVQSANQTPSGTPCGRGDIYQLNHRLFI